MNKLMTVMTAVTINILFLLFCYNLIITILIIL